MALYLSPYRGSGTKADPFRPDGLDRSGSSAIDIRLDPTRADGSGLGFALLWLPAGEPDPVGAIKLADDYGELLTKTQRTRLNQRTGLAFDSDATIQDAVETIMLRADSARWKRLRPVNGRMEAWLGSGAGKRRWVDFPVLAGGTITDNFTRANEAPIASPWAELAGSVGDCNLTSNALTKVTSNDQMLLYHGYAGGWSADHSSQWTYASAITSDDWGPAIRIGANGFSAYIYSQYSGGREIFKFVAGSYTSIETASGLTSVGTTYKIGVVGSTIRYYDAGSEHASSPATDSSLAVAGSGPGCWYWNANGSLDNFEATGEIASGKGFPFTRHPMAHMVVR